MALEVDYKKEHHPGRWIALIVIIAILAASGWFGYKWYTTGALPPVPLPLSSGDTDIDESDVSTEQIDEYTVEDLQPRYIRIPSLDLDTTRIYTVGLNSDNLLESPSNIHDAGWYDRSGTPGDGGIILINAHSTGITTNGAFTGLGTLAVGDSIVLERGDGEVFTYKVVENQSMSIDEVNATGMAMMGKSAEPGKEALNLITFDGTWVPRLGMFDRRIMLRAVIADA